MDIRDQLDHVIDLVALDEVQTDDVHSMLQQLLDVIESGSEAGIEIGEILDTLAIVIDAALPMATLVPGFLGEIAESGDGPAIRAILACLQTAFSRDPGAMRERADRISDRALSMADTRHDRHLRLLGRALRIRARADRLEARREPS